ncbi:MAG: MarR family transcriptional regulator [Actinomycetota bacterium]|nr:MarR family transcriptional regulator [Actinomycetota bacterium]
MSDTTRGPTEKERQLTERLRVALGRLNRSLRLTHAEENLSSSQREVMMAIVRARSIRLSDLAREEGLNSTMLSRIVAKLEAAGTVTRTCDPKDARVIHLTATPKGVALREKIRSERTDALLFALSRLSKEEKQALSAAAPVLETIVAILRGRNE